MAKKIWIKANGNGAIATGHLRRCMTIAYELMQMGCEVTYILSDDDSDHTLHELSKEGGDEYDSIILHTKYSQPLQDMEALRVLMDEEKPDFFLIDSYFVTQEYFSELRSLIKELGLNTKLGYIDDLYKFDYDVDFIVNYDLKVPEDFYSAKVQLLGGQYAPLRRQFGGADFKIHSHAKKVFLSAGGTDPYRIIRDVLNEIYFDENSPCRDVLDFTGMTCEVIVGPLFEEDYVKELEDMAEKNAAITLHYNPGNMAQIMKKCDFAVSAGGTTLYELCAIGVPTVVYAMADNQVQFVQVFDELGAAKYAGDVRDDRRLIQKIVTWGTAAVDNPGFRQRMSDKARSIIDGKGAEKIAAAIVEMIE
jgi:spore coat polysaccharide biosynthesis predicted glycosyltransferase SpsG